VASPATVLFVITTKVAHALPNICVSWDWPMCILRMLMELDFSCNMCLHVFIDRVFSMWGKQLFRHLLSPSAEDIDPVYRTQFETLLVNLDN
ncbi:hypothetical protein P7K49_007471, partial [Saguinus oedipus]